MSKKQNHEEGLQVVSNWECSWSAETILKIIMDLSSACTHEYDTGWMEKARAQDLFNLASVLASGRPNMRDYFCNQHMIEAIISYRFEPGDFLYKAKPGFKVSNDFIRDLVDEYGCPSDEKPSILYYCQKITDAKKLHDSLDGLIESVELVTGAERAVRECLPMAAYKVYNLLVNVKVDSFYGDLARTYAMLALIDIVLTMKDCLSDNEKKILVENKAKFDYIANHKI